MCKTTNSNYGGTLVKQKASLHPENASKLSMVGVHFKPSARVKLQCIAMQLQNFLTKILTLELTLSPTLF